MASILVVDDDPVNRLLVKSMLVEHDVREAANAREALSAVAEEAPDLIILDVALPDVDGFGVLKQLRKNGNSSRVLLYTATTPDLTMVDLAKLYGVSGFLPKPGDPREAIALVRATLSR